MSRFKVITTGIGLYYCFLLWVCYESACQDAFTSVDISLLIISYLE